MTNMYSKDIIGIREKLPILSVGVQLKTDSDLARFQINMLSAYQTLEQKLQEEARVSLSEIKCIGCQYGLNLQDLYQNMIQIQEKKNKNVPYQKR